MEKYFLCFGASIYQINLIKLLQKKKLKVISVDRDINAPGMKISDIKIFLNVNNYGKIEKRLKNLNLLNKICGVITQAAGESILASCFFSKKLNLRSLNFDTAKKLFEKKKLCRYFNKDLDGRIYNFQKLKKINRNPPFVIKIENTSGGRGIKLIKNYKNFNKNILKYKKNNYKVYVEDYVDGQHFGVIGLKSKNFIKVYAIIKKKNNPNFSTNSIIFTDIDRNLKKRIINYINQVFKKINFDFGPFQFELFISKNGKKIFLAEIEASCVGSYITELMIPKICNGCLINDTIDLVSKKKIKKTIKLKKKYSLLKFFHNKKKFLKFINRKQFIIRNLLIRRNYLVQNKPGLAKAVIYYESSSKKLFNKFCQNINRYE